MGSHQETPKANSPGNAFKFNADTPDMRRPHMEFVWRLECKIATKEFNVGAPHGAGVSRSIVNILDGDFSGPQIKGKVLPGGADWATVIEGTHSMTLNAHYTVQTDDGEYIYVQAYGLYRPGPGTEYAKAVEQDPNQPPKAVVTQDDVEFFSHLRLEAGPGKHNWLNGLICIGVMTCVRDRIVIDAYRMTNFPGLDAENVLARKMDTPRI